MESRLWAGASNATGRAVIGGGQGLLKLARNKNREAVRPITQARRGAHGGGLAKAPPPPQAITAGKEIKDVRGIRKAPCVMAKVKILRAVKRAATTPTRALPTRITIGLA